LTKLNKNVYYLQKVLSESIDVCMILWKNAVQPDAVHKII